MGYYSISSSFFSSFVELCCTILLRKVRSRLVQAMLNLFLVVHKKHSCVSLSDNNCVLQT
jgi:hypothetical protein